MRSPTVGLLAVVAIVMTRNDAGLTAGFVYHVM
jgi:hypothetical protein